MKIRLSDLIIKEISNEEYITFYNIIKSNMQEPNWLGDFTSEMIDDVIKNGGKLFNYFNDKEIVCSVMYIPASFKALSKFNLELDFNLVGECGPIIVNPKYIGNSLQIQMLGKLSDYNKKINNKYIITTIHPENEWSIKNFLKNGYKFFDTFDLKRGKRNLYIKEL